MSGLFVLRAAAESDAEYFHHSWISSFKEHPISKRLGRFAVPDYSESVILPMIGAGCFTVACSPAEPAFILGWACVYRDTVIYACVRQRYQNVGVASALLAEVKAKYYVLPPPDPRQLSLLKGLEFRPLRSIVVR